MFVSEFQTLDVAVLRGRRGRVLIPWTPPNVTEFHYAQGPVFGSILTRHLVPACYQSPSPSVSWWKLFSCVYNDRIGNCNVFELIRVILSMYK